MIEIYIYLEDSNEQTPKQLQAIVLDGKEKTGVFSSPKLIIVNFREIINHFFENASLCLDSDDENIGVINCIYAVLSTIHTLYKKTSIPIGKKEGIIVYSIYTIAKESKETTMENILKYAQKQDSSLNEEMVQELLNYLSQLNCIRFTNHHTWVINDKIKIE